MKCYAVRQESAYVGWPQEDCRLRRNEDENENEDPSSVAGLLRRVDEEDGMGGGWEPWTANDSPGKKNYWCR